MKKLITLCFFAITMLINVQEVNAQSPSQINQTAIEKTKTIKSAFKAQNIGLEKSKLDGIYEAYRVYLKATYNINRETQTNAEAMQKLDSDLDNTLKELLSKEQFSFYLKAFRAEAYK
ncbi:hypothetical protein [Ichthyenterobacterium magnum]|uniref:Uncharacterized protein n=1 Tax=Ichthyenterobacterium magnum TaxID=1230530 RepID=A0A420DFK4_9FLAO|nr:hypothetical protein [Ichthyenterobacterium magnum]RKE91997.1 hypothetical protein BXY80_2429 [Ichthyenterobacterium magnum]